MSELLARANHVVQQLEHVAVHAETAPDISPDGKNHRYISAVGLADLLLEAADLIDEHIVENTRP